MPEIVGDSGDNTLNGTNGADIIRGLGGNDIIRGQGGTDELYGGTGDDIYYIDDAAGDVVRELIGEGTDKVYVAVSYVLEANSEVELLSTNNYASTDAINLTGNSLNQTLIGNAGENILHGGGGTDLLIGLGGRDIYYIDVASTSIVEYEGGGNDALYVSLSYTLVNGEVEVLSTNSHASTQAINLTGNLYNQTLIGNAGNNVLNGGGGTDLLIGLAGNDTFYVDVASVAIVEYEGGGNDTLYASTSYVLVNGEVETLSVNDYGSTLALNLTGNLYAQTLIGNAGSNALNGGGGADTLIGLGGNDTYYVDNASVQIVENGGGGNDVVYASVSYTLANGVDVETLSSNNYASTDALVLTGNSLGQGVVGNAGANLLDGGLGNDTLVGLGGADTFSFTTALGAGNVDLITDFATGTDKIQLGGASGQPFAALASGALRNGTLVIGTAAADADDYLIYNSGTGALLYDADGNGAGAAVQFATLSTGLSLTVGDFVIAGPANTAPAITSGATANVAENSAASTIVYQTAANDADGDRITYSLSGTDAALLTIDANGAVRLINPADFETKASYSFNVVVSDSGVATAKAVTLTISDVPEGGPSTPIINEAPGPNDGTGTAQFIDRNTFLVANNANLPDDDLPSATIVGNISSLPDKDFYSITLQAGEKLILDVDGTNGLDSFLTLYNSSGVAIGDNDDQISFDPGSSPPFSHNTDSQIIFRAATSGTYYFSIESFNDDNGPTSQGAYQINVSIGPPATQAQLIAEDIDALISGASWNHTNLTYGFPTMASQYPSDFKEVSPATKFEAFSAGQQNATVQLLQLVQNVTTLTFTQNSANPGQADLRFAESSEAEVAYAYYPTNQGPNDEGGSAWFNKTNFNNPVKGNYAWMGILHETGHALGLKHGHEFPLAVSADRDSVEYTVMTYRSYPGKSTETGYTNETFGFAQTLMMYDIAALQKIYNGANYAFNNGDSVYTWSNLSGEMSINGAGQGAPGANRVFMTVWDGGGNDTYNLSNYSDNLTIDLRPGEWTTTNAFQLAGLGNSHVARGNIANALLFQGNTASAIENATGGSGEDILIANLVGNRLTGGTNADVFKWAASGDAGTGALADTILDFAAGSDTINLADIDANPATGGNDAFAFIGTAAFHNVAGEVRYEVTSGSAHVFADLDGNGIADMEILVSNVTILSGADFVL
jgi:Ca2+-binding RTX toxin-like protein